MSNAVILEGAILKAEESSAWSGIWRFAKDKKGTLQFNYKKRGQEIPSDLLEYVSFLDPASLAQNQSSNKLAQQGNNLKHKKRGRGRPPLSASLNAAANAQHINQTTNSDADATQSLNNNNNTGENTTVDFVKQEDSEQLDKEQQDQNQTIGESNNGNDSNDMDIPTEPNDSSTANPGSEVKTEGTKATVIIDPTHPLMGVWEGNFSIITPKGEELINEQLFFYSTLGTETRPEYKDLPPEPQFPYALLKRSDTLNKVAINPSVGELTSMPTTTLSMTSTISGLQQEPGPTSTTTADATGNAAASSQFSPDGEPDIQDALTATAYGYSPAALEALYKKVLVGFGRNSIGRFSVAALYDESTGELRCEKKYMSVKFAVKRGRRSHAEYAMTYAGQAAAAGTTGGLLLPPDRVNGLKKQPVAELVPPQTRNRPSKLTVALEEDPSSVGMESNVRRKRSNTATTRGKASDDYFFPRTNSTSNNNNNNLTNASHKHNKDYPGGNSDGGYLHYAGLRNPDLDDPNLTYREAFQDCDTGEIYEGSWAYGFRHGKGICVYCDGLLYEGNWIRGKEHGKGDLMTADRKLVYSGDWLDGHMHGYGIYHFGNGDVYKGDWKEGARHGRGEYAFMNGCLYIGDWRDNKRHGKGKFIWPDQSFYEGDWENDLRHGRGILELHSGFKYDGYWCRNVMEGKGSCTFPSGQVYQGTYKCGLRDGRGSVQFAEGAIYEGRFKEDRLDGQGTLKINCVVPGCEVDELLIPVQIQSDLWRIHWKAGFGANAH